MRFSDFAGLVLAIALGAFLAKFMIAVIKATI